MMKIDINKVIILENKEEYLVLDKVNCEDVDYYYIAKINDTKTDIENNYKLVRITTNNDGDSIIEEVTGEDSLRKILPLFDKTI